MGCSCLPLTADFAKMTCPRETTNDTELVKFTSIAGRIDNLKQTIICLALMIASPVLVVIDACERYKSKKSNPLDVLIVIVVSPIFMLLFSLRCLLGALIHPAIALKYIPPEPTTSSAPATAQAAH